MERKLWNAGLVLLLAGALLGCSGSRTADAERLDTEGLIEALHERGITLSGQGPVTQRLLSTPGQGFLTPEGGTLHVFEYRSEASATLDANRIETASPDLTSGPHVFQRDHLIVFYFGNAPAIEAALNAVLGSRIA
jgi:hypothetical protein